MAFIILIGFEAENLIFAHLYFLPILCFVKYTSFTRTKTKSYVSKAPVFIAHEVYAKGAVPCDI